MEEEDQRELELCVSCGADVDLTQDRAFMMNEEAAVCFLCAMARGGDYDVAEERWREAPRVSDLCGDRRPPTGW